MAVRDGWYIWKVIKRVTVVTFRGKLIKEEQLLLPSCLVSPFQFAL